MSIRTKIAGIGAAAVVLGLLGWLLVGALTRGPAPAVPLSELPPQAAQTWQLIRAGGPFPYDQDGRTFENRERLLPGHEPGYYREYTVPTPEEPDRGPRRLITGAGGELYYTQDHYGSFLAVDPNR